MPRPSWNGEIRLHGTVRLTVACAAKLLGVTNDRVRRMCDSGEIPHIRHPKYGYRLIRKSWVIRAKAM